MTNTREPLKDAGIDQSAGLREMSRAATNRDARAITSMNIHHLARLLGHRFQDLRNQFCRTSCHMTAWATPGLVPYVARLCALPCERASNRSELNSSTSSLAGRCRDASGLGGGQQFRQTDGSQSR